MTGGTRMNELIRDLSIRSGRAMVSQFGLRSAVLREHLMSLYLREPGSRARCSRTRFWRGRSDGGLPVWTCGGWRGTAF